ncbi:hypothetical protein GCM10027051_32590 [Niabella terrae]
MPKLDSFQRKFSSQLKVLSVTPQPFKDFTKHYLNRFPALAKLPITYIYEDTLLKQYFPYATVPHVVWIDEHRVVKAITDGGALNEKNIIAVIKRQTLHVPVKQEDITYNSHEPLLVNNNGGAAGEFLYRSLFTTHKPGIIASQINYRIPDQQIRRVALVNQPLKVFLNRAYPGMLNFQTNNFRLAGNVDSLQGLLDRNRNLLFCYELILPESHAMDFAKYLRQDLERYWNITVRRDTSVANKSNIVITMK